MEIKKILYLERVTIGNLLKKQTILKLLQRFATERNLKPSHTVYKTWGKGRKITLRFSKTGNPYIEKAYSTHYVLQRKYKEK